MTHTRYRIIQALKTLIYHALVMLLGVVMVYPLVWMIMSSFKPTNTVFTTAGSLIPTVWTIDNYLNGLKGFAGIPFTRFFLNSLDHSLAVMRSAGVDAKCHRAEEGEDLLLTIRIPRARPPAG